MKKSRIRLVAMLLCVLMCTGLMPVEALAYTAEAAENVVMTAVSNGKPKITSQPKSQSVNQGNTATFRVKATGKNLEFQWYCRKNSKSPWKKVSGGTKATLKVTANRINGYQYRCRVSSGSKKVYSKAATLKVNYVTYRALLIGEINFDWGPRVADKYRYDTCTRNKGDVQRMKSMLSSVKPPKGGSYKITCKYNLDNNGIKSAITSAFSGADSNDVSLFFIATHGETSVSSGDGAGSLCTTNGTSVSQDLKLGTLASWLKAVPGKVIVILGSCGSGAAISRNGVKSAEEDPDAFNDAVVLTFAAFDEPLPADEGDSANIGEFRNSKFYVLTAAKHMESSWGRESHNHDFHTSYNYFPYYIAKGGKGAADSNKDRKITLNELFKYASKNARGPYWDGYDYYYQHARVYPSNSSYVLFKTA